MFLFSYFCSCGKPAENPRQRPDHLPDLCSGGFHLTTFIITELMDAFRQFNISCCNFQNSGCGPTETPDDKALIGFAQISLVGAEDQAAAALANKTS